MAALAPARRGGVARAAKAGGVDRAPLGVTAIAAAAPASAGAAVWSAPQEPGEEIAFPAGVLADEPAEL